MKASNYAFCALSSWCCINITLNVKETQRKLSLGKLFLTVYRPTSTISFIWYKRIILLAKYAVQQFVNKIYAGCLLNFFFFGI